jgi:hypothetical protein
MRIYVAKKIIILFLTAWLQELTQHEVLPQEVCITGQI